MPDRHSVLHVSWINSDRLLARLIAQPVRRFLRIEAAGGILLLAATVAALVWANSPAHHSYVRLWHEPFTVALGPWRFHQSLGRVVNDGLMALFFFVIGLEIKREWVAGELRDRRAAVLPVVAAVGGMVVPALLYAGFNVGSGGARGWGIPMATDIAFALGVLTLLGRRIPNGLKVFLLTLAIVDDIGAILVIAVVYSGAIDWVWLATAAGAVAVIVGARAARVRWPVFYVAAGLFLWLATYSSGVHATIAGVVLGLLTPAVPFQPLEATQAAAETLQAWEGLSVEEMRRVSWLVREAVPVTDRMEDLLHPWTSYVIVPVFALANAGVELRHGFSGAGTRILLGVAVGLVVGKAIGVTGASWLVIRSGLAPLPDGVRWRQLAGVGALAGIGFTMSLFMTDLAFRGAGAAAFADHAKVGILLASVVAAAAGVAILAMGGRPAPEREGR